MLTPTELHVYVAAALHFTQYPTMRLLQRKLDLRGAFSQLPPVPHYLVSAITSGIILYVAGTGILAAVFADPLLHSTFGTGLCLLQSVVWLVRVAQQLLLVRQYWPRDAIRVFWMVTSIYASLATLYTWFWLAAL